MVPALFASTKFQFILLALMLFLIIITIRYIYKTIQLQEYYPIRELGPKLTIVQEVALLIFSLTTLAGLGLHSRENQKLNFLEIILTLLLRTSRGIFVLIFITKGVRIYCAYKFNVEKNPSLLFWLKLLANQNYLILICAFSSFSIWTLLTILEMTIQNKNVNNLLYLDTLNNTSTILNFLEIITTEVVGFLYFSLEQNYKAFKIYVFLPILIYSGLLYINTFFIFFSNMEQNDPRIDELNLTTQYLEIWSVQLLRTFSVFYFMIIRPLKKAINFRYLFRGRGILNNFDSFLKEKICREIFITYLLECHPIENDFFIYYTNLKYVKELKKINEWGSVLQQFLEEFQDRVQIDIDLLIGLEEKIEELYQKITEYYKRIFERNYKKTKSFQFLEQFYAGYELAVENFHRLDMQSEVDNVSFGTL